MHEFQRVCTRLGILTVVGIAFIAEHLLQDKLDDGRKKNRANNAPFAFEESTLGGKSIKFFFYFFRYNFCSFIRNDIIPL